MVRFYVYLQLYSFIYAAVKNDLHIFHTMVPDLPEKCNIRRGEHEGTRNTVIILSFTEGCFVTNIYMKVISSLDLMTGCVTSTANASYDSFRSVRRGCGSLFYAELL